MISTQPGSAILFWLCQKILWHGTRKHIMRNNSSFSQHRHFLYDKFLFNNKSLHIHKRWYSHDEWHFETVLDHKRSWILFHILKRGKRYFLMMIIYVILRTAFDIGLYSIVIVYDKIISGCIRDTFSNSNSNSNHTSTVSLLTDSFCREESITKIIRVKSFKKGFNWNNSSFLSWGI